MDFLSVVVTTYHREKTLRTTLDRLANQTLPQKSYEVLVMDDESPDGTPSMVHEYMRHTSMTLRYHRHSNRGPGATENEGIRQANGPLILLIADDIQATPTMLEAHVRTHREHPEPNVAVAGKVIESPDLPQTVFQRNWNMFQYDRFEGMDYLPPVNFWASHISAKKDFLMHHGLFIEHPKPAHEDTELGWRLWRKAGLRIRYCPEALAHHYHPMNVDSACRQFYQRGNCVDGLTDHILDPEFYVWIELLTRKTFPYFIRAWRGQYPDLPKDVRNAPKTLAKTLVRGMLFNRVTVPWVAVPVIRAAERHRALERFVTPRLLQSVIVHYFRRGIADLRRQRRRSSYPEVFAI